MLKTKVLDALVICVRNDKGTSYIFYGISNNEQFSPFSTLQVATSRACSKNKNKTINLTLFTGIYIIAGVLKGGTRFRLKQHAENGQNE